MKKSKDGNKGRIPNKAIKQVYDSIKENGFYLTFHYFAYDSIVDNMSAFDIQKWRAFDKYAREHDIPEQPLEI